MSRFLDHLTSQYQNVNIQFILSSCKWQLHAKLSMHRMAAVCWSPVQVKCLQRSDLSRLDLVKWRSAHGQVVKPLIRLGIQPVIRLGVKRDGNLSQFGVNNTSNQFLQLAQNSSGTV